MDPNSASVPSPGRLTDSGRERDVFAFNAALRDVPRLEELGLDPDASSIPTEYVRKPGSEASLAAFCQLAAMRVQTTRALISLIDSHFQYILAEATPRTSLRAESPLNRANDLQFGSLRLPRRWGVCEKVLDPAALSEGDDGIIIINDLTQVDQYAKRSYVQDGRLRFYAGVPLISKSGSIVGALCLFDDSIRNDLPADDIVYLKDLAITIVEYLETYTVRDRYRRGAEGLHSLMSFAQGATCLRPLDECRNSSSTSSAAQTVASSGMQTTRDLRGSRDMAQQVEANPSIHAERARRRSVASLQDSLLPMATKELFARAADLMRRSNEMDGVSFLDASLAAFGSSGTLPVSDGKLCQVLAFATSEASTLQGDKLPADMTPYESSFRWVLEQYPSGYSLDTDASDNSDNGHLEDESLEKASKNLAQHTARLKALIPNIKSALFLPLWDFDRGRWYAGCFCWSIRKERVLDGRLDLPFLKAFGLSIMQEVARMDALTTKQAKNTFLSSLSHELRTPLHGILGSSHLLLNSSLDSFQMNMVNSVTVCGRTLLETVEHLLDHAEHRDSIRNYPSRMTLCEDSLSVVCEASSTSSPGSKGNVMCNIGMVTEEVVETMVIGESPFNVSLDSHLAVDSLRSQMSRESVARKRSRFLILDIGDFDGFGFRLAASSYGRVLINLLGNALKFTESGYIYIGLDTEYIDDNTSRVMLRVEDTGIGMSRSFLEKAFEPFKKSNQHTSGMGVGLSVVQSILEDIGGRLDIRSELSKGTDVTLAVQLDRLNEEQGHDLQINPLSANTPHLVGRKVCILYNDSETAESPEHESHLRTLAKYVRVLTKTLGKVLKLDVHQSREWDGQEDTAVVVCPEISFAALDQVRKTAIQTRRKCPATIFIAMDVVEAETIRNDVRVMSKESIVESVTQPCGPQKLSVVLKTCLQSYDAAKANNDPDNTQAGSETSLAGPQDLNDTDPRLGQYTSSLAIRARPNPTFDQIASPLIQAQTPKPFVDNDTKRSPSNVQQALLVDDNAINRRLLSTFMKRHKVPFKDAKDGQEALDKYKEAYGTIDVVLMDISMPIMDGMTSTRLIREFEKENGLAPAHIIALTGLTSASAKLEAWTSGVDDFLTKPVDFKKMESLMEAGRSERRSGFWEEDQGQGHGTVKMEETGTECSEK